MLLIMTDDVGYGASSTFGGPVPAPARDWLAKAGVRFSNSHTMAMCSPTRAALLTGRNRMGGGGLCQAVPGFVQDPGTAPSVGVYFGDVVAPRGASNNVPVGDGAGPGAFFDLSNVQVLKGPQGTLQGRNTTGGAVLLVPQKPVPRFEAFAEGSLGNFDMRRLQAVVNLPVLDTLSIRVGVDRQTRDGYLRNNSGIGPRDFGDVDYTAVRFSAVADLTPDLENYMIVSYSSSNTHGTFQKLIDVDQANFLGLFVGPQLATQGKGFYDAWQETADPYSKLEQWQVINTTTWRASDTLTIKNISSYAELRNKLQSSLFGTNLDTANVGAPAGQFAFASVNPIPAGATGNQSTFTEELQFQGSGLSDRLTYQAGAYLEISKPLGLSGSQSPVYANCSDIANLVCTSPLSLLGAPGLPSGVINYTSTKTSFRDVGLYSQITYKLTEKIALNAGARYTWDSASNQSQLITFTGFPALGYGNPTDLYCSNPATTNSGTVTLAGFDPLKDCRINLRQKSSAPTWLIGFDYKPLPDIMIYAKYARGYRTGTVAPTVPAGFNSIEPEKVDTFEIGSKTSFSGAVRGSFNVAALYNNFSNQQIQLDFFPSGIPGAPVVWPTTAPANAGKSRIWGVEVDGSIEPFDGFTISGAYAYLNTEIRSTRTFVSDGAATGYIIFGQAGAGDPLQLSPKNKYSVTASYELPVNESLGAISLGATFTHTDSSLGNYSSRFYVGVAGSDPQTVEQFRQLSYLPSSDLLNLNVSWNGVAGSPVDLAAFVTNVTKEKYYTSLPGVGGTGLIVVSVGEPRMYGMRLKVRFGK
ncbi:TonB-dependent receptor [Novosphingobium sp. RD2P27]|uniref:TonB-dependent receptor n=1 Tax=Novosphingobium kalidii TaxID=3230299 RepID=A0ABV2D1M3_9SPHN